MPAAIIEFALSPWWAVTLTAAMAPAAWPLTLVGLDLVRGAE